MPRRVEEAARLLLVDVTMPSEMRVRNPSAAGGVRDAVAQAGGIEEAVAPARRAQTRSRRAAPRAVLRCSCCI